MIVEITKNNIKDYANDLLLEGVVETNFNNNPYCKYIAYIDKELVGYIYYSLIFDRLAIDYIFVKEDKRRKGIATELFNYLLKYNLPITLEVNTKNIKAINLYKKIGFKEVSIRKNYYGEDDGILMEKR